MTHTPGQITMKWEPIDTAPKDGSYVILARWFDLDGETYPVVTFGHWLEGYGDASDEMGICSGWNDHHYTEFDPGRDFGNPDFMRPPRQPTHWMPLPAPPEQEPHDG